MEGQIWGKKIKGEGTGGVKKKNTKSQKPKIKECNRKGNKK